LKRILDISDSDADRKEEKSGGVRYLNTYIFIHFFVLLHITTVYRPTLCMTVITYCHFFSIQRMAWASITEDTQMVSIKTETKSENSKRWQ